MVLRANRAIYFSFLIQFEEKRLYYEFRYDLQQKSNLNQNMYLLQVFVILQKIAPILQSIVSNWLSDTGVIEVPWTNTTK